MNSQEHFSGLTRLNSRAQGGLLAFLVASGLLATPAVGADNAPVAAYEGTIRLPTYPWLPALPHPYFRGTDGNNIYPYPMMDNLDRTRELRTWRTVVLENEYLRITFLPELGGRVYEVQDKIGRQSMFYVNHVVKPGLIGQCGAWISGGIEFNTGPAGHTVSAVLPVDVAILPAAADGSRAVAVGEVEKIYRTRWTVVVTLHPGRTYLEETIQMYNGTETIRPYYFWNCTAMPNTAGFRFIYPMTLGSDHGSDKFFSWPMFEGKDLSLGRNYQDASSIFARECDQDFFGSYDEDKEYGVVAYANHHQLPGKKAWTWGHGGYGTMHQMDLTDADGPYNEVQTGPLITQGEVGRLDPGETVRWREWWYPVRGLGGFNYASRDLAANATRSGGNLRLRLIGTGTWKSAQARVLRNGRELGTATCDITPLRAADLSFDLMGESEPVEIQVNGEPGLTASFRVPLDLPARTPPVKRKAPATAVEFAQAGWQEFLFAKFGEAETSFRKALTNDAQVAEARVGLALIHMDHDPAAAADEAAAALKINPDSGLAHFALAVASDRLRETQKAIDHAWQSALDPVTAIPGRALAAKLHLQRGDYRAAMEALAEAGPWQGDAVAVNRLAFAELKAGHREDAVAHARQNLRQDPLDAFARSILWLAKAETELLTLRGLIDGKAQSALDLAAEYDSLGQKETALGILEEFYLRECQDGPVDPIPCYWAAYLSSRLNQPEPGAAYLRRAQAASPIGVFPHRWESAPVLRWALEKTPQDGNAALYLGHLLFSLGGYAEGRQLWQRAADLNTAPVIAYRALGMASRHLEGDDQRAADYLERANRADPRDPIVARDLAQVLFAMAEKTEAAEKKNAWIAQARDRLAAAFESGRGRADFIALLARAHTRLGNYEETARLLDAVRITIWEGGREVHDLFEQSHLTLGKNHLEAKRYDQALTEFNRALEYPPNLATGKLEHDLQAHIHLLRGNALAALGRKTEAGKAWQQAIDEPSSSDPKIEDARKKAREARDANR